MKRYLIVDIANQFAINGFVQSNDITHKISAAITRTLATIAKLTKRFDCDRVVICCEGGSWRRDAYPQYKAHRRVKNSTKTAKEIEEQEFFFAQTDLFIRTVNEKSNAIVLKCNKIEGDDFVARWIDTHPNDEHIILSNDSDFYQLLQDNVRIYNPSNDHIISNTCVLDEDDNPAYVERVVTEKLNNISVKKKKSYPVSVPDSKYELFKKIVRGDAGDNISSAYPRAPEKSTKNKVGIKEAFLDMNKKGLNWNMFMLKEWEKIISVDDNGKPVLGKVTVKSEFSVNEKLINLRMQPDNIKDIMDEVIKEQEDKSIKRSIGIDMMKISNELELYQVSNNLQFFITPLAKV